MDDKVLRKIQRRVNKLVRSGTRGNGILIFRKDGSGGTWYPADTTDGFWQSSTLIILPVPWGPITLAELRKNLQKEK